MKAADRWTSPSWLAWSNCWQDSSYHSFAVELCTM